MNYISIPPSGVQSGRRHCQDLLSNDNNINVIHEAFGSQLEKGICVNGFFLVNYSRITTETITFLL